MPLLLHAAYKKLYFLLQVMQESVSGTARYCKSHAASEHVMKSKDKIIITIVPAYIGKKYYSLALLLMLCTCNNKDGNKFWLALYYGDNYIFFLQKMSCFVM